MSQKIFRALFHAFAALLFLFNFQLSTAFAQVTAFTYQGRLTDNGQPANGIYDFQFRLYDAATNGSQIPVIPISPGVVVSNGLFTMGMDFGSNVFDGTVYWLEIAVQPHNGASFTTLAPRQEILPVPGAIFANAASNLLGTLPASQLNGALPSAQISGAYSGSVTFDNNANNFNGTFGGAFNGNGAGVTNLNATQLTGGTVSDARLSSNVALLNANQTFNGANNFTNLGNSFSGSFFGNGLIGWIATNGAAIQAQVDHGYLLTNSQLVTVTLPSAPNVGDIVRISGPGASGWEIAQNTNQSVLGNFLNFARPSWSPTAAPAGAWDAIASSADGVKLVAAISGGGIYSSIDSGATWTETNSLLTSWSSIACSADGSKMAAVVYGGEIYTNSGNGWGAINSSGLNWSAIASSADGNKLAAAIFGGAVYTSANFGMTWTPQSGVPGNGNWQSLALSADGSTLVAADSGVGIYVSTNSGANWSLFSKNANWSSVVSSANGTRLAALANGGGIYTSSISGASWIEQSNAPTVAAWASIASSADGSKLAATVNGGSIYLSSNFGLNWIQQTNAPAKSWNAIASSTDGGKLAAVVNNATTGGIYVSQAALQTATTSGTNGFLFGGQGSAVELQYIGNNQFMPVSSAGTIWAY